MAKKIEFSEENKRRIKDLYYNSDYSIVDIGKEFGVSRDTIFRLLNSENCNLNRGSKNLSQVDKDNIVVLYKNGYGSNEIAREYNCSSAFILNVLEREGCNRRSLHEIFQRYSFNEKYFDDIDTEDKAYFLGLMYADGYNNSKYNQISISLQEKDKGILDKFNYCLSNFKPLRFNKVKNKRWQNYYKLDLYSEYMSNSLSKLGVIPRKSLKLRFPQTKQVPNYLISHFIRGYWDGDGWVGKVKMSVIGTRDFIYHVKYILESQVGVRCMIEQGKDYNKNTISLVVGGRRQCSKVAEWLYGNSKVYMERKKNAAMDMINGKYLKKNLQKEQEVVYA